jgi:hypothetical protein
VSTQSLWAANALWAGPVIVARLLDQVPDLRAVLLLDEIDPKLNAPKQMPAAVVLLDRMSPATDTQRHQTLVQQDWMVALAVRSAARDADRNSAQVGPLIPQVVKALQGWVPPGQLRALAWRPGTRPSYGRDNTYWPLMFSLQVVTA